MQSFCFQCEQTIGGRGCVKMGNCGKEPQTSVLQDLVIHMAKAVSMFAHRAAQLGAFEEPIGRTVVRALYSTGTNVNFDADRLEGLIRELEEVRRRAETIYQEACTKRGVQPETLTGPAAFRPGANKSQLCEQAVAASIQKRLQQLGPDLGGLQELLTYGLKGLAAYAEHARVLGREDRSVHEFVFEALDLLTQQTPTIDQLLAAAMRCGEVNLKVMALLDGAHVDTFGHPQPTSVRVSPVAGPCILVSGHDLHDLRALLEQTAGRGINIYTHGEMLPAHGYPELHKHPHLAGNYGGAWQDQQTDFAAFPGPILMTTNCIQRPAETYQQRIFTTGLVAWPGVRHLPSQEFGPLIEAALAGPGFPADQPAQRITVGFGRQAILSVADKVIDAVKSGAIRHFFLIGGCDGARSGRNYYSELAASVPKDCVILTLACGKYRFNKMEHGDIGGIPRLLDVGQCNDAYSAIQVAAALAKAFDTDVNGLPLSLVLSWYEQKAVAILLTLLHLGIKNIRLGPSLPAFLSPAVLGVLVDTFQLKPTTSPADDLTAILGSPVQPSAAAARAPAVAVAAGD